MHLSLIGESANELILKIPIIYPMATLGEWKIMPVSSMINHYKGDVKKWCNKNNFPHFAWQSRFHEHIIRNNVSYNNISNYIASNVYNWDGDSLK